MSTLNDTDLYVIERSGTNYQVRSDSMSTLQDTDLFVVERSGTNYQVEAKDIVRGNTGTMEKPVEVLTPFNGAGLNEGEPYEPLSSRITAVNPGGEVVYATDTIANVGVGPNIWDGWYISGSGVTGTPAQNNCRTRSSNGGDTLTLTFYPEPVPITSPFTFSGYSGGSSDTGVNCTVYFTDSTTASVGWDIANNKPAPGPVTWTGEKIVERIEYIATNVPYTQYVNIYNLSASGWGTIVDGPSGGTPTTLLTLPTDNNFDKFEVGDVVQTDRTFFASTTTVNNQINAFTDDTSYANASLNVGDTTITWRPKTPISGSQVVVRARAGVSGGSSADAVIQVGSQVSGSIVGGGMYNSTLSIDSDLLTEIVFKGTGFDENQGLLIESITVDGTQLIGKQYIDTPNPITAMDDTGPSITVDGGSWYGADGTGNPGNSAWSYPSQMWSNRLTSNTQDPSYSAPGGFPPAYPRTNAFNGQPGTTAGTTFSSGIPTGDPNRVGVITFDASGLGIEVTSNVFVWSNKGAGNPATVTVTTSNGTFTGTNSETTDSSGVSLDCTGTLISVTASTEDPNFRGIKIDQLLLVDSSVSGGRGETTVSKTVASEQTLTFVDDKQLDMMVGPLNMVDENGDIYRPQTSAIASITPASSVYHLISDASTGFPNTVDLSAYAADQPLNILTVRNGEAGQTGSYCTGSEPGYGGVGGDQSQVFYSQETVGDNNFVFNYAPDGGGATVILQNPTQSTQSRNDKSPGNAGNAGTAFSVPQMPDFTFDARDGGGGGNATGSRGGGGNGGSGGVSVSWSTAEYPSLNANYSLPGGATGVDGSKKGDNRQGYGGYGGSGFGAGGGGGAGSAEDQGSCGSNGAGGSGAYGLNVIQLPIAATYVLTNSIHLDQFSVGDAVTSGDSTGVVVSIDLNTNSMQINFDVDPEVGATIIGRTYEATADDVIYSTDNVLGISNITGTWITDLYAQGAEVNRLAPDPNEIVFTSMNGGTTEFTGKDASLTSRVWELNVGNSAQGPWTIVGSYTDMGAAITQNGATPWEDHPALEYNKFYEVRVTYDSNNANSSTSTFNTFKTGNPQ